MPIDMHLFVDLSAVIVFCAFTVLVKRSLPSKTSEFVVVLVPEELLEAGDVLR